MNSDINFHFLNHLRETQPDTYLGVIHILNQRDADLKKGCHDIMNILSLITGNYQLLCHNNPDIPDRDRFNLIGHDLKILTSMMNSIGEYRYAHNLTLSNVDMYEYLWDFAYSYRDSVIANIPDTLPSLAIDRDKISFVMKSIVENVTDEDVFATIKMDVSTEHNMLKISFADELPAFDREVRNNLFTIFNTNKKDHPGISLATSYKILNAHRGSLSYSNNYPCGSIFTLWLPLQ